MRERVNREKEKVKLRNLLTEHIFGTMKRNFNQGYMLLKRKDKVGAEMALTVLAYNITRVLNIVGLDRLIRGVKDRNLINDMIKNKLRKFLILILWLFKERNKKFLNLNKIYRFYPCFSHSLSFPVFVKLESSNLGERSKPQTPC